ncbi:MAG: oligosaccharide flippase family protein [Pyrinomonadaceae bacterium]
MHNVLRHADGASTAVRSGFARNARPQRPAATPRAGRSVLNFIPVTSEPLAASPANTENSPTEDAQNGHADGQGPSRDEPGRHAERQTADWDIRNAPKNYVSLVAAHVATAFFSFASVWLLTRKIGSEGYGAIVAFVAASQLAQIFLNWSSTALARFGIEEFVETGKITRSFWARTLLFFPNLALVLVLAAFWLHPVAAWLKIPDAVVWLIAIHLFVTSVWLHVQYALQGVKMLWLQGALLAVERTLTFAGLLAIVGFGELTLNGALWCYIAPAFVLSIFGLVLLRPFIELKGFFDREHFRKMLVYSLPLIPFAVVGYLSTSQLDAFFITRYLSTSDLGIYAVAAQINSLVLQLPILANSVLLSMFVSLRATGQNALISKFLNDIIPSAALVWGVICIVGATIGALLIPIVFGEIFQPAAGPLVILIMASVVSSLSMFGYATYSHSISATYISTVASVLAATTNVALDLLLIPRWGLIGCAMATFFSQAVLGAAVVWLCAYKTPVSFRKVSFAMAAPIVGVVLFFWSGSEMIAVAAFLITTVVAAMVVRDALKTAFLYAFGRLSGGRATTSN